MTSLVSRALCYDAQRERDTRNAAHDSETARIKDEDVPMPSVALLTWQGSRATALDEIENAHRSVGGSGPGRRTATQHINQAYAVLLSSHFQGFCRDLHTECIDSIVPFITPVSLQATCSLEWNWNRKLDHGNPNPGNIASDFNRLGIKLWPAVYHLDARNHQRLQTLEELNEWRNAIAHQDFDPAKLGGATSLRLSQVRNWRTTCSSLAGAFDVVMSDYIHNTCGKLPW
jgi:hypothetical protein